MRLSAALLLGAVSAVVASPKADVLSKRTVNRAPDAEWDFVTKGASHSDKIAHYNLRSKAVDPTSLGVDKVKQYSGYLDNEANDKHLFYCKTFLTPPLPVSEKDAEN